MSQKLLVNSPSTRNSAVEKYSSRTVNSSAFVRSCPPYNSLSKYNRLYTNLYANSNAKYGNSIRVTNILRDRLSLLTDSVSDESPSFASNAPRSSSPTARDPDSPLDFVTDGVAVKYPESNTNAGT